MPISLLAGQSGIREDAVWISPLGSRYSNSATYFHRFIDRRQPGNNRACRSLFVESQRVALQLGFAFLLCFGIVADDALFHGSVGENEIVESFIAPEGTAVSDRGGILPAEFPAPPPLR